MYSKITRQINFTNNSDSRHAQLVGELKLVAFLLLTGKLRTPIVREIIKADVLKVIFQLACRIMPLEADFKTHFTVDRARGMPSGSYLGAARLCPVAMAT